MCQWISAVVGFRSLWDGSETPPTTQVVVVGGVSQVVGGVSQVVGGVSDPPTRSTEGLQIRDCLALLRKSGAVRRRAPQQVMPHPADRRSLDSRLPRAAPEEWYNKVKRRALQKGHPRAPKIRWHTPCKPVGPEPMAGAFTVRYNVTQGCESSFSTKAETWVSWNDSLSRTGWH